MDILHNLGIPIIQSTLKLNDYDIYESDFSKLNVYCKTNEKNEKYFIIKVDSMQLTDSITKLNLIRLVQFPHENILPIVHFSYFNKEKEQLLLWYEFKDILLYKFISKAQPDLNMRLNLMKQFLEILIHFYNNNFNLDYLDLNYIFIETIDNPKVKVLYNGNLN